MDAQTKVMQPLGLLISVRNLKEARVVDSVGIDVLDIKEPSRGPLGKADDQVIEEIIADLGKRNQISAALGDLEDCESYLANQKVCPHLDFAKCGLAWSRESNWQSRLRQVWQDIARCCQPVAVAYVDWQHCNAPCPLEVLEFAAGNGARFMLLDTFQKNGSSSLELVTQNELLQLTQQAHRQEIKVVLAGSIKEHDVEKAFELGMDLLGVRGAVCSGNRTESIDVKRCIDFKKRVDAVQKLIA